MTRSALLIPQSRVEPWQRTELSIEDSKGVAYRYAIYIDPETGDPFDILVEIEEEYGPLNPPKENTTSTTNR